MTAEEILAQLQSLGNQNYRELMVKHGASSNQYGVKIEELKKIQKKVKKDHALSLELYKTGVSEAQYLAGLIADEKKISEQELQQWVETACWSMQSQFTVPWIAAESSHGWKLGLEWIGSDKEMIQVSGWSTLSSLVAVRKDEDLHMDKLRQLLHHVEKHIHTALNLVRYAMNGFVIAVGGYVPALTEEAIRVGKAIGKVSVNMGQTACKVPSAPEYIQKMKDKGVIGKKRKMARC